MSSQPATEILYEVTIHFASGDLRYNFAPAVVIREWAARYGVEVIMDTDTFITGYKWDDEGNVLSVVSEKNEFTI
jgi:hypothetical protein